MSALHEALASLAPTSWADIPAADNQDALRTYVTDIARNAQIIVDSVPEPPPTPSSPSEKEKPSRDGHGHGHGHDGDHHDVGTAYKITPSAARFGGTGDDTAQIGELQRAWSKPIKPAHSRDNPHHIPLYKMAAKDGGAVWFARRSVHEGMPFRRWKEMLSCELEVTLRGNERRLKRAALPDRVVRGLGAIKRAEGVVVKDHGGDEDKGEGNGEGKVLGGIKVYDIAAHFPKPTTARDFVQANIAWEDGLAGVESENGGKGKRGRSWLSVSKPCEHPELPPQDGYIRGRYESVEFIREIVTDRGHGDGDKGERVTSSDPNLLQHDTIESKDRDRKRGKMDSDPALQAKSTDGPGEDEANPYPVEWIMVTRSDPGGSIPRWVIEKGTPKSIWSDTVKFLDWASREDAAEEETAAAETDTGKPGSSRSKSASTRSSVYEEAESNPNSSDGNDDEDDEYPDEQRKGLIANFAYLLNAGLERYAPQAVLDYMPYQQGRSSSRASSVSSMDTDADAASLSSDAKSKSTSKENKLAKTKTRGDESWVSDTRDKSLRASTSSRSDLAGHPDIDIAPLDVMQVEKKGKLTSHEKQLAKLAQRKRDVQVKLESTRAEIETFRLDNGPGVSRDDLSVKEGKQNSEEKREKEKKDKEQEKKDRELEKALEKERKEKEKKDKEIEKKERERRKVEEKYRKEKEKKDRERDKKEQKERERERKKKQKEEKGEKPEDEPQEQTLEKQSSEVPRTSASFDQPRGSHSDTSTSNARKTTDQLVKPQTASEKEEKDSEKHAATLRKTISTLSTQETKLLKQLTKIEREQLKLASKIEARQQKAHDREERDKNKTEVEALRAEVDGLKKEVERLRAERGSWVELVGSLQGENVKLARNGTSSSERGGSDAGEGEG